MLKLVHILPEVAVVVAIVGAILFTGLVFRNPFRSKWLQRESMSVAAALGIAAAVCFGAGTMIAGAVAAGFGVAAAIVLTIAAFGGAGYAIVRGFHIGERLRRADAGQSPFYPQPGLETLRRLWQRQFRGRAGV
jgi:hypothetical protein